MINPTSIFATLMICLAGLPRFLYFVFGGKKRLPPALFEGSNLFLFIITTTSFFSLMVMSLLFSTDLGYLGKAIIWYTLTLLTLGLLLILWIIFFMNGYDPRYQFKKIGLYCPNALLIDVVFWLTILFTENWFAIIPCTVFTVTSFIWNFSGYRLTKPIVDDDVILRENDDF